MPQRKQITWTELRVGLFIIVALFILAVGIFYVTGAGILTPRYELKTYLPEVSQLKDGAPVTLDGVPIGNVTSIQMTPRTPGEPLDRSRSIELVMSIDREFQNEIRSDSIARLITEGLLGNRIVEIQRGFTGEPLATGSVVTGSEEASTKQIVERSAELVQNLNALSEQVRDMVDGIEKGRGSLGKFLVDEELYNRATRAVGGVERIVAFTEKGEGTVGKLFISDDLYQKTDSVVSRLDTILADVQGQKGTLGQLVYDPELYQNAKSAINRTNALVGDVQAGKGTLGKLVTDEALYSELRDAAFNVKEATAKLNSNRGTAGKLFTDPVLYDNLSGLTGDLRLLMGEIRQNPKKYLHVKFSIF